MFLNARLLQLGKLEIRMHRGWSPGDIGLFGDKQIITRPALFSYNYQDIILKEVPFNASPFCLALFAYFFELGDGNDYITDADSGDDRIVIDEPGIGDLADLDFKRIGQEANGENRYCIFYDAMCRTEQFGSGIKDFSLSA